MNRPLHRYIAISFILIAGGYSAKAQPLADTIAAREMLVEAERLIQSNAFQEAETLCQDAQLLFETVEGANGPGVADALVMWGGALIPQRKLDLAIQAFSRALAIRKTFLPNNHTGIDFCYSRLGGCWEDKGNYDQALIEYNRSLDIRKEIYGEKHRKIVSSNRIMGSCYFGKGDYDRAFDLFRTGYEIQTQLAEDPDFFQVRMLINMGEAKRAKGDLDNAVLYYHKALDCCSEYPESPDRDWLKGVAFQNLGSTYDSMGQAEKAISYLNEVLEIYESDNPAVGSVFGVLANCHSELGEYEQAETYLNQWIDLWTAELPQNHPYFSRWYQQAGAFYILTGDSEKGIGYLEQAKDLNVKTYGGDNPAVSQSYIALGNAYLKESNFAEATLNFQYALIANSGEDLESDCSNPEFLVEGYQGIGEVYLARYKTENRASHLTLALNNFEKAISVLRCHQASFYSSNSKSRLSDKSYPAIEKSLEALKELYEVRGDNTFLYQAFDLIEQSKSMQLFESIQEAEALQFAGIPQNLLQKENDLRIDLTFLDKKRRNLLDSGISETNPEMLQTSSRILDLQQEYEKLRLEFENNYPTYYSLKYDLETVGLPEVQQSLLGSGNTLLEYFVGDESVYLFAIRPDSFLIRQLPLDFKLESLIEQMRFGIYGYYSSADKSDRLMEESVSGYIQAGQELYKQLIRPVSDFIEGAIIIVPDGSLGYLPFDALLTSAPPDLINFSTYPYLFKDYPISYSYSATLLKEMVEKQHFTTPEFEWIGFAPFFEGSYNYVENRINVALENYTGAVESGDLSLRARSFSPLPNSGEEMAIGCFLWQGKYILGLDATRERFQELAGKARILHLSTHGVADPRVGDFSYLAFSDMADERKTGLLYVRDLYNVQLNADLVVLSACETGVGELKRGEGIISLARAFAYAGAKSILTSLWVVDDASTMDLIKNFYVQLRKGKQKEIALQEAKLLYLEKHPGLNAHPFFWAGFIPIGDMGGLVKD